MNFVYVDEVQPDRHVVGFAEVACGMVNGLVERDENDGED